MPEAPVLDDTELQQVRSEANAKLAEQQETLNTLIAENDIPWFGIPFPGTYVIDRDGRITHKFFDSNLAVRAGPEQFLRALRGDSFMPTTAPHCAAQSRCAATAASGRTTPALAS